jgi:hypothetical protein
MPDIAQAAMRSPRLAYSCACWMQPRIEDAKTWTTSAP